MRTLNVCNKSIRATEHCSMNDSEILYNRDQQELDLQAELMMHTGDSEEGRILENAFFRVGNAYLYKADKLRQISLVQGLIEGRISDYRYACCWLETKTEVIDLVQSKRLPIKHFYRKYKVREDQLLRFRSPKEYSRHSFIQSMNAHVHKWFLIDVPIRIYPDGKEKWAK